MTTWRASVAHHDGVFHDVVIDATDAATVDDLFGELSRHGFNEQRLLIDGRDVPAGTPLHASPLRNASRLSTDAADVRQTVRPGWYLVAVAGPDTGAHVRLGRTAATIGRSKPADLAVNDPSMSAPHLSAMLQGDTVLLKDLDSTNGTVVEHQPVNEPIAVGDGTYVHAGATTFAVVAIEDADIPVSSAASGPSTPFQRRFREHLPELPKVLKHPAPPNARSNSYKRPLLGFAIPIISAVGMALLTGRYIFLAVIALGPIFFAVDGVRRRRTAAREEATERAAFELQRQRFIDQLKLARTDELARDRWTAAPAGLAALLAEAGHARLWERAAKDDDFVGVAVGLFDRPSNIVVEGRLDEEALPFDTQWSAVLRHSLFTDGPLAIVGPLDRARALGRSLLLDIATSHSPHDVKLWLLTDSSAEADWSAVRWLPHAMMGPSQGRVFSTSTARATAVAALRAIINDRLGAISRERRMLLPIHVVMVDGTSLLDTAELTDLLVDGAAVGVVGVSLDSFVTPEGCRGRLVLGDFSDEASFFSDSQMAAHGIRTSEMTAATFERAARSLAALRAAGSSRDDLSGVEVIRLVELVDAPMSLEHDVAKTVDRWRTHGHTTRVRVGGLRELITDIDLMRDGPHGLVAGTTRAGKTEFLKSLITSLAVANHPDDLSIIIVDFKGGVDHELSERLPHVIDLSTNHGVASFTRSVRLMEAELERRQREYKAVGAPNFDAYHAARRANPALIAIPRLLIIVDEYAELLKTEAGKASISALESIVRVGGGLGVHLLLVTQSFENHLPSQIAANTGLRVCFRVERTVDSDAVLGVPDAAFIPQERIGRALMRSKGGPLQEFQAARIAGPRAGREIATSAIDVRRSPFGTISDAAPIQASIDVPAQDTEMFSVVEVLRKAAADSGWQEPAVPWPKNLPTDLTIGQINASAASTMVWPIGQIDEPEMQRQSIVGLEPNGAHVLIVGSKSAEIAEVLRGIVVSGCVRRPATQLHMYVIDLLGQGLSALSVLPHVGGVSERNEPLANRILRYLASEVGRRKAQLADVGATDINELRSATGRNFPEIDLVVHGCDRLLMHGESQQSPLLGPILGLLSESSGTGIRVVMTGPPGVAHHRVGSAAGRRFILECSDPQEYSALSVPRGLQGAIAGTGRGVNVASGHLMQFALVPSTESASPTEVIRAIGQRLHEQPVGAERALPTQLRELVWPLPIREVLHHSPPAGVTHPIALAVDTDSGAPAWLDASEDGPVFVVCGPSRSGRSTALVAGATLASLHGWKPIGLPLSRRSPLATGKFEGSVIGVEQLTELAGRLEPTILFIDDAHKWQGPVDAVRAFLEGPGARAIVIAGPTEFFAGRHELLKVLPSRCALILSPRASLDGTSFGVRRLSDEVLRDSRPGRGVLVVAGETINAQVPVSAIY